MDRRYRGHFFACLLLLVGILGGQTTLEAQESKSEEFSSGAFDDYGEEESLTHPTRLMFQFGVGGALRLIQNIEFTQKRFAPVFVDLQGAVIFAGSPRVRHGVALGVSTNLSIEGTGTAEYPGYRTGILASWVIEPAYLLRWQLDDSPVSDFVLTGKVGLPLALSPAFSPGVELAIGGVYYPFAQYGFYAEIGMTTFFGAENFEGNLTIHPLITAEAGITIDMEIL